MRQLAEGAGQLDARRARPDHDEREPRLSFPLVLRGLGGLEGVKDPTPHRRGIVDGLQTRRHVLPGVVSEVVVTHPRRDDQRIVGNGANAGVHTTTCRVDVGDLGEQHARVALPLEHRSDR